MKTFLCSMFLLFFAFTAFANIAMPVQEPPPSGDIFSLEQALGALRLEHENLILDLTRRPGVYSRARYEVRNTGTSQTVTDLLFMTPYMDKVTVMVNGEVVETTMERIATAELPWRSLGDQGIPRDVMPAYRFSVTFPANAETVIEVEFVLPAGYDNTDSDLGMYPGEAAHALNWGAGSDSLLWYAYFLDSANTFQGGIRKLDLEIIVPAEDTLDLNFELEEHEADAGVKSFTGSFDGTPASFIEAKVKHKVSYSMIGGSFGAGLVTNYINDTQFIAQAMFDFYFYNHQISAGVEGNPFGTAFKLPVMYTFILGDKMNPYMAYWGDLRLSGGALFDIAPDMLIGFRVAAGLRLFMMIFEVTYDFYPFDQPGGYVGRMTFMYKMSI